MENQTSQRGGEILVVQMSEGERGMGVGRKALSAILWSLVFILQVSSFLGG